jgi:TorA maturation chaperone TorD
VQTAPVTLHHPIEPEDQARADCYALLAALYGAAPDARLLRMLADAPRLEPSGEPIVQAYNRLLDASAAMDPDAARQEYDDLFVGVGKSEVDPHAAHWRSEPGSGSRELAALRAELARLGIGRKPESSLYEDHIAALCETMRLLIGGNGERRPSPLAEQRQFFERQLHAWPEVFCGAIEQSPLANYYRRVAEFTRCFLAVERDSLAMD